MAATPTSAAHHEINRRYAQGVRHWTRFGHFERPRLRRARYAILHVARLILAPFLLPVAGAVLLRLRISDHRELPGLHRHALRFVDSLSQQYPMHLYPLVLKAIQLAWLNEHLPSLLAEHPRVVEVAIGEGSLSSRILGRSGAITALDLNPYSLAKVVSQPHIRHAVVCDGMRPPLRSGSYEILLSMNFLHHVTDKNGTLERWARAARFLVFNEDTPFWASGWTRPYILRKLGFRASANRAAARIAEVLVQHLDEQPALVQHIHSHGKILVQTSFLSERTFFYCSLFSLVMMAPGPPTPRYLKAAFLGPLRFTMIPLTRKLAERLIRFDATQGRARDVCVMFLVESHEWSPKADASPFCCPRCAGDLTDDYRCVACQIAYPVKDGMLFLLPAEFQFIADEYNSDVATTTPDEHL